MTGGSNGTTPKRVEEDRARRDLASPRAENAEDADLPVIDWEQLPANSANSAGCYVQKAVYPADSILADWFAYASQRTKGAECCIIGTILPVVAGLLGRRVWMTLAGAKKYSNIFALICGKPGDRKSTTIKLVAALARLCLPKNAFIPDSFSPESLFDEFDERRGGRPDKLWLVDDANSVLTDWQKTQNGERNATRFLTLYDCNSLSESFRRNGRESEDGELRRFIAETSTSIVFGGTFNVACFQGQAVRAGMARRFLYYVAERHGCDLFETPEHDSETLESLAEVFRRCAELNGTMKFSPDALPRWREYQTANRAAMDDANPLAEDLISRLASAPAQTLAVAMVFEAAIWAKRGGEWKGALSMEALESAVAHVAEALEAASFLDNIANRFAIAENAEVIFERIQCDFAEKRRGDTIYASRSELTRAYCHDSGRRGALKPHDFYNRVIPALTRQGKAALAIKNGIREVYAFRATE